MRLYNALEGAWSLQEMLRNLKVLLVDVLAKTGKEGPRRTVELDGTVELEATVGTVEFEATVGTVELEDCGNCWNC